MEKMKQGILRTWCQVLNVKRVILTRLCNNNISNLKTYHHHIKQTAHECGVVPAHMQLAPSQGDHTIHTTSYIFNLIRLRIESLCHVETCQGHNQLIQDKTHKNELLWVWLGWSSYMFPFKISSSLPIRVRWIWIQTPNGFGSWDARLWMGT